MVFDQTIRAEVMVFDQAEVMVFDRGKVLGTVEASAVYWNRRGGTADTEGAIISAPRASP